VNLRTVLRKPLFAGAQDAAPPLLAALKHEARAKASAVAATIWPVSRSEPMLPQRPMIHPPNCAAALRRTPARPAMTLQTRMIRTALPALFLLLTAMSAAAVPAPQVEVTWAPTDQLTEVKDNRIGRGWLRPGEWQHQLADHLAQRAARVLPAGERLQVHIDDIDLAGSFEPWHRPGLEDARIMKDIYPPRMDLHYRLIGADGETIREGSAKLRDVAYLQRTATLSTDPLRYDKRLIDDWLRKEFQRR
jgi:hypothetical protein